MFNLSAVVDYFKEILDLNPFLKCISYSLHMFNCMFVYRKIAHLSCLDVVYQIASFFLGNDQECFGNYG